MLKAAAKFEAKVVDARVEMHAEHGNQVICQLGRKGFRFVVSKVLFERLADDLRTHDERKRFAAFTLLDGHRVAKYLTGKTVTARVEQWETKRGPRWFNTVLGVVE